ncbi:MAG: Ig-like domain-containing protein, partial [Clostridiales bacterium]|nr:Ig-like domain-containing protein [Clostridiales bacterium]
DADDIAYFKDLARGTYTLVAHQVEADDYGELSQSMTFSVTKATNTWTTTPYITGWTYKQFTANNFQEGVTEFGEKSTVTYKLYKGNKAEGDVLITFSSLNDADVIDYFKALGCDTYTLSAYQIESESYYELSTPLTFAVTSTTNSWATKPRVIGWTYGSFDNSYFIAGVPTLKESMENGTDAVVKYTLTKDGDDDFTPVAFTTLAGAGFASLGAGSYTISVSYVGTDNYAELTDEIEFTVGKYTNTWNPSPSLRGWGYKNFNSALFTAGAPTMQDDEDAVVTYNVTGGTLAAAITLTVTNGTLSQASVDALTALAAGDYTLTATYAGTDNYDAITATSTFAVAKIDNSWSTRPRLLGWTFGAFESNYFIAGVPTLKEDDSAQVQYTLTKDGDDSFTPVAFTTLAGAGFASLNAGAYTLSVYYAGTDNYEELDDTVITFTVSKVNNTWDTQPTITGFVYKQFTEENSFIAGVPHYPLANKTVYYAIGTTAFANVTTLADFNVLGDKRFTLTGSASFDEDIVNYFNGLGFGKYYFAVFVSEADNYT